MNNKQNFLNHLQTSFRDYFTNVGKTPLEKAQAKSYIDGLMAAARIFDVSFDELQQILTKEKNSIAPHKVEFPASEIKNTEDLEIPTFIRNLQLSK